jgi:chromosome segregation ATPase
MIAAVKVESSALDTMRDKLKEVDNLRAQISAFNKRLIDADQSNLSLKSALMKAQESYSDLHKQKSEVESTNVQLRQELNRAKDLLAKEKAARQSAQQEIISLREKVGRYEAMIENLERDAKAVPVLQESNEILKNDLNSVRRKYKEEKAQMVKHMRTLESQQTNAEALKSEMRTMAMRLMDLANGTNSSATNNVGKCIFSLR